jgi:hypothetical protein
MLLAVCGATPARAAEEAAAGPEPAPPEGQEYTGSKRCASCHFEQFTSWKKTGHSKAFEILTAKYQKDPKCLKCHTTGFGEPTGFKDSTSTGALAGITCETCHGPGSKHEEVAKPFAQVKNLTPEQSKMINDSIWRMLPKNVCVECHKLQGHGKSETPAELQKKK